MNTEKWLLGKPVSLILWFDTWLLQSAKLSIQMYVLCSIFSCCVCCKFKSSPSNKFTENWTDKCKRPLKIFWEIGKKAFLEFHMLLRQKFEISLDSKTKNIAFWSPIDSSLNHQFYEFNKSKKCYFGQWLKALKFNIFHPPKIYSNVIQH